MSYVGTREIANELRRLYDESAFVTDKTGARMVELIGSSFVVDSVSLLKPPNEEFHRRELEWYLSGSTRIEDFPGGAPALWKAVADDTGNVKSNYGFRILSEDCGNQYINVRETLAAEMKRGDGGRRGVMVYSDPMNHEQMKVGCRDFVCTNAVNYYVRAGYLHTVVQMRSNDAVFGYGNDVLWQLHVQAQLANDLLVKRGPIVWQAASLHVYERHFKYLEERTDAG